jgi:hypothetical protein
MLQNAAEMAVFSSKMLQIARETDRTGDQTKNPKRKKYFPKQFRTADLGCASHLVNG